MTTLIMSSRGQVVIPKPIREQYHLTTHSKLACLDTGRGVVLVPLARDPVAATRGIFKDGPSLTQALLEERRRDRELEERKLRRWHR